jgi:hypothetical protein
MYERSCMYVLVESFAKATRKGQIHEMFYAMVIQQIEIKALMEVQEIEIRYKSD